jgi:hypothetical protein
MLATTSTATGIAGQLSTDETAWFTLPFGFVANSAPKGFERALVALGNRVHAGATDADADADADATGVRSRPPHSGAGDAPYEHR